MFVRMLGLYGGKDDEAWYRKLGDCFDFVSNKEFATDISEDECKNVIAHKDFYLKQFDASKMIMEK